MLEMEQFMIEFNQKYQVLGTQESVTSSLKTRWDIANVPVGEPEICIFPKKYLFFTGCSSSGKSYMAKHWKEKFPKLKIFDEIARVIMKLKGWKRIDLDDKKTFIELQWLILEEHKKLLDLSPTFAIVDRSLLDALVYLKSQDENEYVKAKELYSLYIERMKQHLIIFFPYDSDLIYDDGIRKLPCFKDEIIYRQILKEFKLDHIDVSKELDANVRFNEMMDYLGRN